MPDTTPKTLAEALVALQAQLPRIPKTDEAQVGTRTYRYANLATITDLLMPIMAKLGLAWTCQPTMSEGAFILRYQLWHTSGDSMAGYYPLPTTGTPQQIGSAITYARRYALTAITGIAPADDDDDAAAAERAAQLMTPEQQAEHAELRKLDHPRKAERTRGKTDDASMWGPDGGPRDAWTDQPAGSWEDATPEDKPGSSNSRQHQQIGILYGQLGITDRAQRLTDMTDRLGRTVTSAKDLSFREAEASISDLKELAAKEAQRT